MAWRGHGLACLACSLLVFLAWGLVQTRRSAYGIGLAYYACALWPCVSAGTLFFGGYSGPLLWLGGSLLLAIPFAIFWSPHKLGLVAGAALLLLVNTLPGFGFISVASPLIAAGCLFPHAGWFGLASTFSVCFGLASRTWRPCAVLAFLSLICNVLHAPVNPLSQWTSVDTSLPDSRSNLLLNYRIDEQIQQIVRSTNAIVILLPEGVIRQWDIGRDGFWRQTIASLQLRHATVLIGAGLPIPGSRSSGNGIAVRGEISGTYQQRIPVPLGMWGKGVPLLWDGPAILTVDRHKTGILICWEQLLVFPAIQSFDSGADSLLAISNLHWVRHSPIDAIQENCVQSWARLFGVPYLRAVNR